MPTAPRGSRKSPLDHDPAAVHRARTWAGWTQARLAQEVDISAGHMSEIEKGTRNAPPHLLRKIALALNCPVTMLERKRGASVA